MNPIIRYIALALLLSSPKHDHHADLGVTSMDVYAEGNRLHLLIARRTEPDHAPQLEYSRSDDGGETWTAPVSVDSGQPPPEPAHRGMDAQVAAAGDRVVALWTTEGKADRFGRGPMACARSTDGGKTWSAGANPSDDGQAIGHAFIDLAADASGVFHAVWLDGRERDGASGASTRPAAGKGLRYARSDDAGASWSANRTLDGQTCECCWNTIAVGRDGKLFVLYRDFEPRDMAIVCSDDAGRTWSRPVTVGEFNWTINGCPHVGGALALPADPTNSQMYAAVWTAKDDTARGAYVLSSPDAGRSWSEPRLLGDARPWHPDIACGDGEVVAAWDAYVEGGTAVFVSRSTAAGRTWSAPQRYNSESSSATHPRIVHTHTGFRVFWTESGDREAVWVSRKVAGVP
jgi:Neuraminidase (sialidase)